MTRRHDHDRQDGSEGTADTDGDKAAIRRLIAARYWIAARCPYYTVALYRCALRTTRHVGTVAIDRHWRIWANPDHISTLTVTDTAVELMHLLNHVLRGHHERAQHTVDDPLRAAVWNVAADCEINDDLLDGLPFQTAKVPDRWPAPWKLRFNSRQTAEQYYRQLLDSALVHIDTGDVAWPDDQHGGVLRPHADCGSAATGITPHWEPPPDTDTPTSLEARLLRRRVAQAAIDHERADPESVPDSMLEWAKHHLGHKIDWRRALTAALKRAAHHKRGNADYTWTRPPRRPNPTSPHGETLRPASTQPMPDIAVIVDTSSSMTEDQHGQAVAEIDSICRRVLPGHHIDYYTADTKITHHQRITNTRNLPFHGGGGTDMAKAIQTAAHTRPTAIIVLTDGYTPWPDQPPPGNPHTIAALTSEDPPTEDVPGWMQVIEID